MRILANENFPLDAVISLRADGHDVWWVRSDSPGLTDREVLHRATLEDRLIVTFDKDFGELAFHSRLPVTTGVILFRVQAPSSAQLAAFVTRVINSRDDWFGNFAVVDSFRVRLRVLPVG
jgi:predicted nuclease of predicted toxin-antitoxin system